MPNVYAFTPVMYAAQGSDLSAVVAPPYDVLDLAGKQRLLDGHRDNIVGIDLPHVPAKELGPAEAYTAAGARYRALIKSGVLAARGGPALFAYRQTFVFNGKPVDRCGMFCTLDTVPFGPRAGGGVLPHEETFSGPKEDRKALMRATRAQLSPIFGLHADEHGKAAGLVRGVMSRPADFTARMAHEDVKHELWRVEDEGTVAAYRAALAGEDVFIADGHHRYNTALNYLKDLEAAGMGQVGPEHPARRTMFVLVSMSDPGLVIGPTHRVLGGMKDYMFAAFLKAAARHWRFEPIAGGPAALYDALMRVESMGPRRLALYDFESRQGMIAIPASEDPLAVKFPQKPAEWRTLDVALTQYAIVEEICQPVLNGGGAVKWAFPHSVDEVIEIGKGAETGAGGGKGFVPQMAVLVRPTPLEAVRAVSRANELMPQKSTFFYPKLATGLCMYGLE